MKIKLNFLFFVMTFFVTASHGQQLELSLIKLIANPVEFNGKNITISGFLHYQFEDSRLYLSKEDADYLNVSNSIKVDYGDSLFMQASLASEIKNVKSLSYFDGKFVTLNGDFDVGFMRLNEVKTIVERTRWFDGGQRLFKAHEISRESFCNMLSDYFSGKVPSDASVDCPEFDKK